MRDNTNYGHSISLNAIKRKFIFSFLKLINSSTLLLMESTNCTFMGM